MCASFTLYPREDQYPLGFVSALLRVSARAHAHAHQFTRYLTVTVKIRTLGSNVAVALSGSLVWWDSP